MNIFNFYSLYYVSVKKMKGENMDKISELLAEAKPLYQRRQREKQALGAGLLSMCLALGIWVAVPENSNFSDESFDTYFTALYLNEDSAAEYLSEDSVIPLDSYGLYEV